jgi:hypothetical protein
MRGKLYGLGAALLALMAIRIAIDAHLHVSTHVYSYSDALRSAVLAPAIGSFRAVDRWNSLTVSGGEIGANYRGPAGGIVSLDLTLGAWAPHNGVTCFLLTGAHPLWQRLRIVRTLVRPAVFDVAMFRDGDRLRLFANTECYAAGCREDRVRTSGWTMLIMRPERWLAAARPPIPVSILLQSSSSSDADLEMMQASLLDRFERFASALDLSAVRQAAGARKRE